MITLDKITNDHLCGVCDQKATLHMTFDHESGLREQLIEIYACPRCAESLRQLASIGARMKFGSYYLVHPNKIVELLTAALKEDNG